MPLVRYDETTMLARDHAPAHVVCVRQLALAGLSEYFRSHFSQSISLAKVAAETVSDVTFTAAYRVPPQYSRFMRTEVPSALFLARSEGAQVVDIDGNRLYDLAGSYGVNVFGYEFYKRCIENATLRVNALGPVLGAYHPIVVENAERIAHIAGLDEVSFHMSGTEAVMQAVRLARYHTQRRKIVRFSGAYHGWWGDVQPGIGNPMPQKDTFTLSEMSERSLDVLATRADIACVLINPLQALHPNQAAPADSGLIDSSRRAAFDRARYQTWLESLRAICTQRGIALIFDEVFLGFRLARGGAQEYFGVPADLVTYGKTLGGGLPIGVVCGQAALMKRYRESRPADICFARGTFNSHPYVMAAMEGFLNFLDQPESDAIYAALDERWDERLRAFNLALERAAVPVRAAALSSVWTILYDVPSRYNWMLQYYLRREGLALSWVGTGRLIFPINLADADFHEITTRFVRAASRMKDDAWWWHDGATTNQDIRRQIGLEMLRQRLGFNVDREPSASRVADHA